MSKENVNAEDLLRWAVKKYEDRVALASSFGAEDMVLIDLLSKISSKTRILTLDTGRLPQETYQLMEEVEQRYPFSMEVYFPNSRKVEEMVCGHGINLFYKSVEFRKLCCQIRKVEPLERALVGLDAWITGLRREQSANRAKVPKLEREASGRVKINPLADWSEQEVWKYIQEHKVPYNKLHDLNYRSIGCAPCTRAVRPSEDLRAGRWWWEQECFKECGLHA